jgi:hypothetical protein
VVISYFLTERSRWRKIALLVAIVAAALSFVQGSRNRERADGLETELVRLKAPRTLNDTQQARIADKVRPFAVREVWVDILPATSESEAFAEQMLRALRLGGINAFWHRGAAEYHTGIVRGVVVANVSGNDHGEKFSAALAGALSDEGIAVTRFRNLEETVVATLTAKSGKTRNDSDWDTAIIVIGDKPL